MKATEWKLGVSTAFTKNIKKETFELYANAGVPCMEISIPENDYESIDWEATKRYSKEYAVELHSFHLPFFPFSKVNIACKDKEVVAYTLAYYERLLRPVGEAGIPIVVVHPSGEPNRDEDRPELLKIAADSLARLAEMGRRYGFKVAVENIPRSCLGNCSRELLQVISSDSDLGVCFDTNHLLIESSEDFIRACGSKIINIHVSDYDFRNERHWLPGEGKLNWDRLIKGLEDVGYSGIFLYELDGKTPPSIFRDRDLTLRDLIENHAALIEGKMPPLIGTPNEEFCAKNSYYQVPVIKG